MSSGDGNIPDADKKFPPTSSNRSPNILPAAIKLKDTSSEISPSTFPPAVPLDLASKPELASYAASIQKVSSPIVNPTSSSPVRLKSQPKQETRPSMSPMKHKAIRGSVAAVTAQPAVRPSSSDPRSTMPRAPFKVDQLVKIADARLNTAVGQPVGVRVPVSISMSAAPPMASIMRTGNTGVINPSTTMHPLISQHNTISTNSSVQYTHVPIGPAAIANITVQKSAAVATPVVRPQFTMTHLNANNKMGTNISGPSPQQQFPISPAIHIKDTGVQLPSAAIAARQQISLNMPSAMLVTPAKTLSATANLTAIATPTDKLRISSDSSTVPASLPVEQLITTVAQQNRPHNVYPHQLSQSEDKGFLKQPIGSSGVTIAVTCSSDVEQYTKSAGMVSGSSHAAAALTSSHTPIQNAATTSMSITAAPYLPHPSNKSVHQAQAVLTSPHSHTRAVAPHQNKSATHIVHTVAPLPLQCQTAGKSGIAVGKNAIPPQTSSVPISSPPTISRPKPVTTTASSSVPIAKVYPQQAIASSQSSVAVQGRLQAADLSNRNVGVNLQQQHSYGSSTVKLPVGMVTNVPAPSSSVPRTTTLNLSTPSASSHVTVAAAPQSVHPSAATDRSTISVDISSSLPYAPPPIAYYYGHQRLERNPTHQQHSPQPKQTTPIRPSGSHSSQPVRLGQMVVSVNPNRPHQLALHPTSSNVEGVTVSLPESGVNAAGAPQLPTIYTISTTVASSSGNITGAAPYTPLVTTTVAPAVTTSHLPPSSPRPSILRKRPSDISTSGIRKNLMSAANLGMDTDSSKQLALLKSPMKTSEVGHDRNVCDKIVVKQEFSDNSESGTDVKLSSNTTYTISSSTNSSNGAASSSSSSNSNGTTIASNNCLSSNNAPPYEASPRKKPRKQQLLANELKEVQSSDGEDSNKILRNESNNKLDSKQQSVQKAKFSSTIIKEDENSKCEDRRKHYPINTYRPSWKTCSNHFLRPSDIKSKDEKKMTVNDLANQKYICQKVNGWKLHHFSVQMDDLVMLESDIHEKLSNLLVRLEDIQMKCDSNKGTDIHRTNELVKANLQRSKLISQQMSDSKGQVFKIFDHKPHVLDIINKYVSKRSVKKRERF